VIDPQYHVFVLGGVVMEDDYAQQVAQRRMDEFKQEMFGTTAITINTAKDSGDLKTLRQIANDPAG
jgi:hypothetical protein